MVGLTFAPTFHIRTSPGYISTGGPTGTGATRTHYHAAPAGRYAYNGIAYDCPAGRYGARAAMTSAACTGVCKAGYYCPAGSTSPTQLVCGAVDRICPEGAVAPLPVTRGYYTSDVADAAEACPPGLWRTRSGTFVYPGDDDRVWANLTDDDAATLAPSGAPTSLVDPTLRERGVAANGGDDDDNYDDAYASQHDDGYYDGLRDPRENAPAWSPLSSAVPLKVSRALARRRVSFLRKTKPHSSSLIYPVSEETSLSSLSSPPLRVAAVVRARRVPSRADSARPATTSRARATRKAW